MTVTAPGAREAARPTERRWRLLVTAAFALVVGVTLWRHEMWRDELQAWMIARDSGSVGDLVDNLRYEGHPIAWYLPLLALSKVTRAPEAMQALQWVVATATVAGVVWWAPFTRLQRALVAAGYFVVFEFGAISRSYSLGALALVGALALAGRSRRPWPAIGALLAVLALTSAFGAIVAIALALGLAVDEGVRHRCDPTSAASPVGLFLAGALTAGGLAAAYVQASPPADGGLYADWRTTVEPGTAASAFSAVWRALVPLPEPTREAWNTYLLDGPDALTATLSAAAVVGIVWVLRRRPAAAVTWLAGVAGITGFLYLKLDFFETARFAGHVFLVLLAALWLAPTAARWPARAPDEEDDAGPRRRLLTAVLVVHAVAGVAFVAADLAGPFSDGRDVAEWIDQRDLDSAPIVGAQAGAGSSGAATVAGYLDREVYYRAGDRAGTYVIWDRAREEVARPLASLVAALRARESGPVLVLSTRELDPAGLPLELRAVFDDGMVRDEHFWLYDVAR